MKRWRSFVAWPSLFLGVVALSIWWGRHDAQAQPKRPTWGAEEGQDCIQCHATQNVALVEEWRLGMHGQKGVNCFDCHRAEKDDPDAFEHEGELIAVIVSPKDCARCHQKEVDEQKGSHHAKAGQILASLDNFLGEVVGLQHGFGHTALGSLAKGRGTSDAALRPTRSDPLSWQATHKEACMRIVKS